MNNLEVPPHVKSAQDEIKWDAEKKRKEQELLTAERVIIKGINRPFWDLVTLLVKIAFTAVPAAIAISLIWGVVIAFLGGFFK